MGAILQPPTPTATPSNRYHEDGVETRRGLLSAYLVLQRAEAGDPRLDPVGLITQLDLRVRLRHQ